MDVIVDTDCAYTPKSADMATFDMKLHFVWALKEGMDDTVSIGLPVWVLSPFSFIVSFI